MHRDIDLAAQQRPLERVHEHALTGAGVDRPHVALRDHAHHLDVVPRFAQTPGHGVALHQCQHRAASAQEDPHRSRSSQAANSAALAATSSSASFIYAPGSGCCWRYRSSMPRKLPFSRLRTHAGTDCGAEMSATGGISTGATAWSSLHGPASATATAAAFSTSSAPAWRPADCAPKCRARRAARSSLRLDTTTFAPAFARECASVAPMRPAPATTTLRLAMSALLRSHFTADCARLPLDSVRRERALRPAAIAV